MALDQIRQALADGVPVGVVLADPAYGNETAFRTGVSALDLRYVLGVQASTTVWLPGLAPLPRPQAPRQPGCNAPLISIRSHSRTSPSACPNAPGVPSPGARGAKAPSHRASPPGASDPPIVTRCAQNPGRRNGC